MGQYQNVLIILRESASAKAKRTKLIKISIKTEDLELKALLDDTVKAYSYYIEPRYSRSLKEGSNIPINHREWLEYIKPRKQHLEEYIENLLSQQKPQWQILAERNGWKPGDSQ